jgi:hypothetical protein
MATTSKEKKSHRGFKLDAATNEKLLRQAQTLGCTQTAIVERAITLFDEHHSGQPSVNPVAELKSTLTRATELANSLPTAS